MGAVTQRTIDDQGNTAEKLWMTHNQSFDYSLGAEIKSVNQRVLPNSLPGCVYYHTLSRLIHAIIALQWKCPWLLILLSKLDFKSAFRRLNVNAQAALQSIVTTTGLSEDPIALASLRVTFGGRPSPSLFSDVSESVTDLANALV